MESIRAAIPDTATWKTSNVDRALSVMFPGPDAAPTSAPRRLFQAWDNQLTEELHEKYKPTSEAKNDGNDENAMQWLCDRLTKNESVKPHLLLVCTLLFTPQPLSLLAKEPTAFTSMLPLPVPNPGPCMVRAVQMAEEACFSTDTVTDKGVASELALATQPRMTAQEATELLRRIARTPGIYDISQQAMGSVKQWATWGGRGWLGT
ncbi:hypothetical protein MNAN1_000120 [Malassezia nana]|uniref:Uncharacterized protein n=1 Tax=Malassezia nana TaxID=180528 RepID=A0AAF0ELZ2_9BASI|nr:hypothetical protein MNAN1_000120 [Malassezia nana]